MPLEILDFAFVLLCFLKRCEGPQVAALPGGRVLLTRIQAKLAGFKFSYHGEINQGLGQGLERSGYRTLLLRHGFSTENQANRNRASLAQCEPQQDNPQSHEASDLSREHSAWRVLSGQATSKSLWFRSA